MDQLDSFMDCEELNRFGRFSFNNYNREVEVLLHELVTCDDVCGLAGCGYPKPSQRYLL